MRRAGANRRGTALTLHEYETLVDVLSIEGMMDKSQNSEELPSCECVCGGKIRAE